MLTKISTAPATKRAPGVSPYLLLTLTPLFWSCNWIIGRGLHEDVPPLAMTFYRWLFALVILAPFALPHVRREWQVVRRSFPVLIPLGVIGIGSHNALAYVGLNYTSAMNGVILNSFIPVMIVTLSWLFLRERLAPRQAAGVAVSLGGVLVILSRGSWAELRAFELNRGDVFVLASMLLWSLYTIGLRWRPAGLSLLSFLFVIAVIGELAILPMYLAETALGRPMRWTWPALASLVAIATFSSVLAYIFWNRGVEQVGASIAGLFVHLMPVFGVVLAWVFLGEGLRPFHLWGIALILTGIWLTSQRARLPVAAAVD